MTDESPNEPVVPQNIQAERAVLGAILRHNEALTSVRGFVDPSDFFQDRHRRIFAAMLSLSDYRKPIDQFTVAEELARHGNLESVGGYVYLVGLIEEMPLSSGVKIYARTVKETAIERGLVAAAAENVTAESRNGEMAATIPVKETDCLSSATGTYQPVASDAPPEQKTVGRDPMDDPSVDGPETVRSGGGIADLTEDGAPPAPGSTAIALRKNSNASAPDATAQSTRVSQDALSAVLRLRMPDTTFGSATDIAALLGLTDAGQAQRFAGRYAGHLCYDHTRRLWLRWGGHYWVPDDDGEPQRCAIALARELFRAVGAEASPRVREAVAWFAVRQEERRKVDDVLKLSRVLAPIAQSGANWDANPFKLATTNGVIDLKTGLCRDGRPDDCLTLHSNVGFDPTAQCPRWERFLDELFVDSVMVDYVQRALGYSATADTSEQVIFICFGAGRNGKSTFIETVKYVLGSYAYACAFSTFEAGKSTSIGEGVAVLAGRRFVTSSETNTNSRFNEARMKALSGGDTMNARFLYGNPLQFVPVCKIWLGVNHKPGVSDDSDGFWRRIHLIPFTQTFRGAADDPTLKATLQTEAAGILNWILKGSLAWQSMRLAPPPAVLAARDAYQHENDPLGEFLDDACVIVPSAHCYASKLFGAYERWCDEVRASARERLGRKAFGSAMTKRFAAKHMEAGKLYSGVGLRADR